MILVPSLSELAFVFRFLSLEISFTHTGLGVISSFGFFQAVVAEVLGHASEPIYPKICYQTTEANGED